MTRAGNTGPDKAWPEVLLASVRHLPPHSRLVVALSGGLDSVLLLHTIARVYSHSGQPSPSLAAIHVNHQLQSNAADTEAFCQRLCDSLSLPCLSVAVDVSGAIPVDSPGTGGLEETARNARYQAFESCLQENDLLLMAHHGDDQAETVLFRLIRGSGIAGLGGMPAARPLGCGHLYRPFLGFSRHQLEGWAAEQGLQWIEDPSNQDQRFDRNFLRQSIVPHLKDRWPNLVRRLASSANACREGDELSARLAELQFAQCRSQDGGLDLSRLRAMTAIEQKNLIRWWVSQQGYVPPGPADWGQLLSDFTQSAADRQPEYRGEGYRLCRYRATLYLVSNERSPDDPGDADVLVVPDQPTVWGNWRLWLRPCVSDSGTPPTLKVMARQGGERIRPRPDGPSKPLKKWLQEQAVPAWERRDLPLVKDMTGGREELVAVGHLWVSEAYRGEAPTSGWCLILERDSN